MWYRWHQAPHQSAAPIDEDLCEPPAEYQDIAAASSSLDARTTSSTPRATIFTQDLIGTYRCKEGDQRVAPMLPATLRLIRALHDTAI